MPERSLAEHHEIYQKEVEWLDREVERLNRKRWNTKNVEKQKILENNRSKILVGRTILLCCVICFFYLNRNLH